MSEKKDKNTGKAEARPNQRTDYPHKDSIQSNLNQHITWNDIKVGWEQYKQRAEINK
jgi:hypothetical protein